MSFVLCNDAIIALLNKTKTRLMKKILLLFLMATTFAFVSCEKEKTNEPEDPSGGITDNISEDMTFKSGETYLIDGSIRVGNATLTFEPGSVIKFTEGSYFDFSYWDNEDAKVLAIGTPELPIIFTSANSTPNNSDWDGFRFYKGANNCEFEHCVFEYGGGSSYLGMIYIEETEVSFKNCIFQHSENIGIIMQTNASFSAFDGNILRDIEDYPISCRALNISSISGNNTYDTHLGILVPDDEELNKSGDYLWTNQGVPYYQEGTLRIGSEGQGVNLTIEPGVHIKFMENAMWDVAYWNNDYATIIANGTDEDPIFFTSANINASSGDWRGIYLYDGANNCSFDFCSFQYAGRDSYQGILTIEESTVSLTNCLFKNSISNGISLKKDADFSQFGGNHFADIDLYAIDIRANNVHTITGFNTYEDGLKILISNDGDLDKKGDYVWTYQTAPYVIEGTLRIGALGTGVHLIIEAGNRIEFYTGAQLDIAYWNDQYASVVANGTADAPIVFTSANPVPQNGDWDAINYYEGSHDCVLNHCVISYGGSGSPTYDGEVFMNNAGAALTISNTHFSHSESNGISVDDDSSADYSNNVTFEDMGGVGYFIR